MMSRTAVASAALKKGNTNTAPVFCQAAMVALALIYGLILCYLVAVAIMPTLNMKPIPIP